MKTSLKFFFQFNIQCIKHCVITKAYTFSSSTIYVFLITLNINNDIFYKAFTFYQMAHDVCAFSNMDKETIIFVLYR